MSFRHVLLPLAAFCGALIAPVSINAQLVHLSVETDEPWLLFKADSAATPWNQSGGFVTKLDVYYDSSAVSYGPLDPGRNFWKARVEHPELGVFEFARGFDYAVVSEDGLLFSYDGWSSSGYVYEVFELGLQFDAPLPTTEHLPLPPLPGLGEVEHYRSYFRLEGGITFFPVEGLAEVYGGGGLMSVTATIIPIPEPSTYALGGLVLLAGVIAWRRRPVARAA
jgi:hypothetical protein